MNKISQLLIAPNGYPCTGLEGTVKKIYERSTFNGQKGDGSVQNIIVERGSQGIKVAIWGRDEFPFSEGTMVSVTPTTQGKGLTIKDNEYQGKTTKVLNVADKCGIQQISEYSDLTEESSSTEGFAPEPASSQASSAGDSALPAIIIQQANLMDVCIQGAQILRQKYPNMTDEQFQAITSSFFIESNKQGVGKSMPTRLL